LVVLQIGKAKHLTAPLRKTVSENYEITQLRVITARNCKALPCSRDPSFVTGQEKRAYFVSVHRICSVNTDNIFIRICEVLDINFTVGTSCERAAPLAEKNAAARHQVM
jgi:hypothetical protein